MMIDLYNDEYAIHVLNGTEGTKHTRYMSWVEDFSNDETGEICEDKIFEWFVNNDTMRAEHNVILGSVRRDMMTCIQNIVIHHIAHYIEQESGEHTDDHVGAGAYYNSNVSDDDEDDDENAEETNPREPRIDDDEDSEDPSTSEEE
jgi:hypothetical protein